MANKNYINGFLIREKQFNDGGSLLNVSINGQDIPKLAEQLQSCVGADGWARFVIAKSREPKMSKKDPTKVVSTHYCYEDTREQAGAPQASQQPRQLSREEVQAGLREVKKAVESDDVPF